MIKLMPFHLDIIDVHGSDIVYALLFCMFLFCSPSPDRNCAHRFFYVFKCYRTENCPRKRLAVAFGYCYALALVSTTLHYSLFVFPFVPLVHFSAGHSTLPLHAPIC